MRAWLLLLAVLATFKPIVQVASTEETASKIFIRAISPQNEHSITKITTTLDNSLSSANSIRTKTELSTAATTALVEQTFNTEIDMSAITTKSSDLSASSNILNTNSDNETNNCKSSTKSSTSSTATDTTAGKSTSEHHQHQHQHQHHNEEIEENQNHEEHPMSIDKAASTTTTQSTTTTTTTTTTPAATEETILHSDSKTNAPDSSSISTDSHPSSNDIENEPVDSYSNKEAIKEKVKPDPEVLVEIENSLLSLFNMKRPPKIDRSKIVIPEAMKKLYEEIMNQQVVSVNLPKPGLLTKSANTVRSFTHQDSKIDHRFPHHHRFRLYFDIKSIPSNEKLKASELHLSRDAISHADLHPSQANRTIYSVLAYDITRVGIRGKTEPSYLLLDNKTIRLNSTEVISVDVQPAVERWLAQPNRNYGLLIEVRTYGALKPAPHNHVRLRRNAEEPHEEWQHKQPLLYTYTDDGRHKSRSIRDVNTRSKNSEHHQHRRGRRRKTHDDCRRHSLYVDFADVGWSDWIVAPPGYDAFYCHGKCPFGLFEHLNTTNHAVVQTLVNNLNPAKVPKPCCVPTQLDGISMLYLNDQNTVVLKNYQDMTVVGCGCR